MIRMTRSVYIDAPVKKVFDFLKNPLNWSQIAPPWLDATYEDIELAPDGTGTFSYKATMAGVIPMSGTCEVTDVVRNRRIVMKETGGMAGGVETETFLFEHVGTGTVLTVLDERTELPVERVPLVGRVAEWVVDELGVQWMHWLKAKMEAGKVTPIPAQSRVSSKAPGKAPSKASSRA